MIATKTERGVKGRALAAGLLVAALVAAGVMLTAMPARADTFRVNSMADAPDRSSTDGECATDFFQPGTEPNCTLRAAIGEANFNGEADTVDFDPLLSGTITLSLGKLQIDNETDPTDDLIIQGSGARRITVSGNDASQVFLIDGFANVAISGLTISNSGIPPFGAGFGAIENLGGLELTNTIVSGNTAQQGGIFNSGGTLTMTNSTVSGNIAASGAGGGIYNFGGTLRMTNSTVSGNTGASGGGIFNQGSSADVELINSTVSGNTATVTGDPDIDGFGGGISNRFGGTVTLRNSIVADNTATHDGDVIFYGDDVSGAFDSEGNNLIGDTTGARGFIASDVLNVNPLLGLLQNNGGPTNTHVLLPGSPAVDAGNGTSCPSRDQRGVARKDGDADGTVICDMGAFERNDLTPPRVGTTSPGAGSTGVRRNANLTATFSEKMDRATLTKSTVEIYKVNPNGTTTQVTNVTVTSTTDGLRATLDPFGTSSTVLAANSRYRAVVTTGAKDRGGNRLDQNPTSTGSQSMIWTFTTGSS